MDENMDKTPRFHYDHIMDNAHDPSHRQEGTGIEKPILKKRLATMCRVAYKGGKLDNLLTRATVEGITYYGLTDKGKTRTQGE